MQTCDGLIQEISDCLNAETKSRKVPRFFYATENVVIPETTCTQVGSRGRIFIFHVESKGTEFNTGVRKSINKGLSEKWNTSIVLFEFTGSNDIDIVCNVPGSGRVAIESRIASIPQDDLQISMATQRVRDLSSKGFSSGELLHEFCMALPRKLQPLNLGVDPKKLDPLFKLQIRKDLHKPLARRKKVLSLLGDLKLENKDPSLFEELLGHQAKPSGRLPPNKNLSVVKRATSINLALSQSWINTKGTILTVPISRLGWPTGFVKLFKGIPRKTAQYFLHM